MRRRDFLQVAGGVMAAAYLRAARESLPAIESVTGPVAVADLGPTLSHEHVLVDFVGADQVSPARYDVELVAAVVRPHLLRARELGFRTLFECTPAYLARDPVLLRRLSLETGLRLVTNTGLYGARNNRFLPPYALEETAEQLSRRWIREASDGIEGTGIRPGFIKCGVDPVPELSAVHARLVDAAGLTHRETGLTIAVHTGRGPGLEQLDRLRRLGVAPAAFIWVHAQGAADDAIAAAAEQGAWVSFDGVNRASLLRHRNLCKEMKRRGLLGRVLLSHDAGWFDPAKPGGGEFRGYDLMSTALLPLLREDGFGERDIDLLLLDNPAAAFSPRRRLTGPGMS